MDKNWALILLFKQELFSIQIWNNALWKKMYRFNIKLKLPQWIRQPYWHLCRNLYPQRHILHLLDVHNSFWDSVYRTMLKLLKKTTSLLCCVARRLTTTTTAFKRRVLCQQSLGPSQHSTYKTVKKEYVFVGNYT